MNVTPFVHEGLGNSSYLVGIDESRAVLIDPDRSIQRYLETARARGWTIEAVFETHLHADFVSGAHEIAAATGATLFLPRDASVHLRHEAVDAGRVVTLGGLEVMSVGSPGHTPEHLAYTVRGVGAPDALFSGGSLIVGGAARTDLISPEATEGLTRAQFRTLKTAFAAMPDETLLFPTHGGGSFCSAGAGGGRTSTLGAERASNPVLAFADEDEFAEWFPGTFSAAPSYYFRMRAFNQAGPRLRREIDDPPRRTPAEFRDLQRAGAVVVDTRQPDRYARGHIDGALSIAFRDSFAVWLGWLVAGGTPLLFITDGASVDRVVDECLLVGYERFDGVLDGGMAAWEAAGLPVLSSELVDASVARNAVLAGAVVLDVRERDEYANMHIPDAIHIPLGELQRRVPELPRDRPVVTYCGHGERSASAISILERAGRNQLLNLDRGIGAWWEADLPVAVSATEADIDDDGMTA
jgi:rhodanese-related sulfurtransferase/glyoxylase-like metal-dependent hydrolase (beta-lactamase superfamily II)